MEGVTPGRIVHYVALNGKHYAAIITAVDGRSVPAVGLTVFYPYTGPYFLPDVRFDAAGYDLGTWHWIERA